LLISALDIGPRFSTLVRPDWTRFRVIWSVGVHLGGLAIVFFLIRAGSWVTAVDFAVGGAGEYAHAARIVNQWIYFGLLVTAISSAAILVIRVARLLRQPRSRTGATRVEPAKEGN
jgi:hypothetical protein